MDEYNENIVFEPNYTNRGSDYKHFYSASGKIWDTVAAHYTDETDQTYIAWLAKGYAVISMQSEADMVEALRFFGLPWPMNLDEAKAAKLAAFDSLFTRLDALKIRPAASIAEALAAGDPAPTGDAYRLSELEAIAAENRELRASAEVAETVEAVQEVEVWWPEG